MENDNNLALWVGISLVVGLTLGLVIMLILKNQNSSQAMHMQTEKSEGVMYNYDAQNRLQSIIPIDVKR